MKLCIYGISFQNIFKSFGLKSTFIEISNPKTKPMKTDIIVGFIYKHLNMNVNEFSEKYLNKLLDPYFLKSCIFLVTLALT